ncbi:uncharacterized protein LOC143224687 [Tachypleus tridentatus]|uniref:uncharacterized protein LOC143224687 n=1 Tax=Tachypleus tridentatus TaxID=6853 RepID=UPI003FD3B4A0
MTIETFFISKISLTQELMVRQKKQKLSKLLLLICLAVIGVIWYRSKESDYSLTMVPRAAVSPSSEELEQLNEYRARKERIKEVCQRHNMYRRFSSYADVYRNHNPLAQGRTGRIRLRTNHPYGISACLVHKAASNTVISFLFIIPPNRKDYYLGNNWHPLSSNTSLLQPFQTYIRGFPGYFVFMFVRHPFARLVSSYRDRVTHAGGKHDNEKTETFYQNPNITLETLANYKWVPFDAFIKALLVVDVKDSPYVEWDWKPANYVCAPCNIDYDFVGKVETIGQDIIYLAKRLGFENEMMNITGNNPWMHRTTEEIRRQIMSNNTSLRYLSLTSLLCTKI